MNSILQIRFFFAFVMAIGLSTYNAVAQTSIEGLNTLQETFIKEVTNRYQEKVFLNTDRSLYITGETIWLQAYCVDAGSHIPSDLSKVLSIELSDGNGVVVLKDRFELNRGLGSSQLFIPPALQSGVYILRAYTNWMRNFDAGFVFQKKIAIINPSVGSFLTPDSISDQMLFVNFFPEGGDLVAGLESKIGVKVTDGFSKGLKVSILVLDKSQNTIVELVTSEQGYGSFNLRPKAGETYTAIVTNATSNNEFALPKAKQDGLVMSVQGPQMDTIGISVTPAKKTAEKIYVLVHSRGILKQLEQVTISGRASIKLDTKKLDPGISHITIMNENFLPLAERLVFKYPSENKLITMALNKSDYGTRSKVSLSIENKSLITGEKVFNLSVSVSRSEGRNNQDNIVSNLLLSSDINGSIPDPWTYFDSNNPIGTEQMDLIMLTNGWRRFNWEDVLIKKSAEYEYIPELHAPIISGKILTRAREDTRRSLEISFPGKASFINSAPISTDGRFFFEAPFRINSDHIYFFAYADSLNPDQIELDSPFGLSGHKSLPGRLDLNSESKPFLERLSTNIQVSQVYRKFNHINGVVQSDQEPNTNFYGKPDVVYLLDDYTRFETMEDLFIEYIAVIYIRKKNKKRTFYVAGDFPAGSEPLVMVDGLPVDDFDFVMSLDPLKIEKIEIVNKTYFVGDLKFSGIINFSSYTEDYADGNVPELLIKRAYQSLQHQRIFFNPDYTNNMEELKRIPDYRNTLYWNPDISLNNNEKIMLEFFTADDLGLYQVEVNGITTTGVPIHSSGSFTVSDQHP